MLNIFRRRLAQIMQRDHEVWVGGQRYVRHDQIEEACRYAEREHAAQPRPRRQPLEKPSVEAFEL